MAQKAIQVKNLIKKFGEFTAVNGVSFSVGKNELFGMLGPNGAGKTTTLEMIEGLKKPSDGETEVLGHNSLENSKEIKERIGVQLQASAYFDYLTLKEILTLFGSFYRKSLPPQTLLAMVSLTEKANSKIEELSGGQKQRFSIAAALVNDPDIVFLDEPTTGLDPQARRSLWQLIKEIHKQGKTIVLTTHYLEEAEALCDRVAIIDHGQIIALDTVPNLIATLPTPHTITVSLSKKVEVKDLSALPHSGEVVANDHEFTIRTGSVEGTLAALLKLTHAQGIHIESLAIRHANLEDVFLALTGHELRE